MDFAKASFLNVQLLGVEVQYTIQFCPQVQFIINFMRRQKAKVVRQPICRLLR